MPPPFTPSRRSPNPSARLAIGYTYLWADQGAGYRSNLNGWVVRPVVNVGRGFTIFFSNTNYYGHNAKGELNSHGFTLGLVQTGLTHATPQAVHLS